MVLQELLLMKPFIKIVGIVIIAVVFSLIVTLVGPSLWSANLPQLPENMTIDQWETGFGNHGLIGVVFAGIASLFWYCLCQWAFKIYNPQDVEKKGYIWLTLFLLTVILSLVLAFVFTLNFKVGGTYVYLFYVGNCGLCYYLSTFIFFTPTFQHIPWPAAHIRIL